MVLLSGGKFAVTGRTIVGGAGDFGLVRYEADGSLDSSFGGGTGKVTTNFGQNDEAADVAAQPDGKLVVVGYSLGGPGNLALARYNLDGSLDSTFDGDGKVLTDLGSSDLGTALALQSDGKIVVVGATNHGGGAENLAVVRYLGDATADTTPPTVTVSFGASDGSNGWFKTSPVVGSISADETASGGSAVTAISCARASVGPITGLGTPNASAALSVSAEGLNNVSCTATDAAGNTGAGPGSSDTATIKIDTVAPGVSPNGAANSCSLPGNSGWCRGTQVAGFTASDGSSGLTGVPGCAAGSSSCDFTQSLATEGDAVMIASGQVSDLAGNTSPGIQAGPFKIDQTNPAITFLSRTPPNASGWNDGDVSLTWGCQDALSGPAAAMVGQTVSTEGANQSATGTCSDTAGNTVSDTQAGINVDRTAPSTAATVSPAPNGNGWNNTDASITLAGADPLSGVTGTEYNLDGAGWVGYGGPIPVTADGTHTLLYRSLDAAGNQEADKTLAVKLDKVAPTITGSRTPAANGAGWSDTDVTVSFTCSDGLSGIESCGPTPVAVSTEGAGQSRTGTAKDKAGNSATATVGDINVDKTAPSGSASLSPNPNGAGWNNGDVTISLSGADSLSGVKSFTYGATGAQNISNTTVSGAGPVAVSVTGEGTTTLTFTVTDAAGNSSAAKTAVVKLDKTAPAAPTATDPASQVSVPGATSYTLQGTAEAGSLVRAWVDANQNGKKDSGEAQAGEQQLASGATNFSIKVALVPGFNYFVVTAKDAADNESAAGVAGRISSSGAPAAPDLALSKQSQGQLRSGQVGTYQLTVTNKGQVTTSGPITVTDTLPQGLGFQGASGANCSLTGPTTVQCTVPAALASGAQYQFTLRVGVGLPPGATVTNTAQVATPGDSNAANDTASDTATVR